VDTLLRIGNRERGSIAHVREGLKTHEQRVQARGDTEIEYKGGAVQMRSSAVEGLYRGQALPLFKSQTCMKPQVGAKD